MTIKADERTYIYSEILDFSERHITFIYPLIAEECWFTVVSGEIVRMFQIWAEQLQKWEVEKQGLSFIVASSD